MGQTASVRAIDNAMVNIEADDSEPLVFEDNWTAHVRYLPRYGRRATTPDVWSLELAPAGALRAGVRAVQGQERERFNLAGGEVAIFDCGDPRDARWSAWLGPWNMAHCFFYPPQSSVADVVDTFSRVVLTDTPEGMTADPGERFELERAVYLLQVTGVGTLMVESKRAAGERIPRWRGLTGTSGEIWRLPAAVEALFYASDSAVVTLLPWDVPPKGQAPHTGAKARGTAQRGLDFLRKVRRVEWVS